MTKNNIKKNNYNHKNIIDDSTINIDFDLFTTEEIVSIYQFYGLIIKHNKHKLNRNVILDAYASYRKIINNLSLEKKYDKEFESKIGISIYRTIKDLEN